MIGPNVREALRLIAMAVGMVVTIVPLAIAANAVEDRWGAGWGLAVIGIGLLICVLMIGVWLDYQDRRE